MNCLWLTCSCCIFWIFSSAARRLWRNTQKPSSCRTGWLEDGAITGPVKAQKRCKFRQTSVPPIHTGNVIISRMAVISCQPVRAALLMLCLCIFLGFSWVNFLWKHNAQVLLVISASNSDMMNNHDNEELRTCRNGWLNLPILMSGARTRMFKLKRRQSVKSEGQTALPVNRWCHPVHPTVKDWLCVQMLNSWFWVSILLVYTGSAVLFW